MIRHFLVKKRPFKQYLGKTVKVQQPKSQKQGLMWISCLKETTFSPEGQLVKLLKK